jgi:hypothetical protein
MNIDKPCEAAKPLATPAAPLQPEVAKSSEVPALNATQHGCCATSNLILPGESIADFKALETTWRNAYAPASGAETHLVDQLITADWLLARSIRTLVEVESQLFALEPNPLSWSDQQHKAITRFQRYRTAHQNAVAKCRKAIDDLRRNRTAQLHKEEKQEIVKERFKIYERKNRAKPTFSEMLAGMKQQAIREGRRQPESPQS